VALAATRYRLPMISRANRGAFIAALATIASCDIAFGLTLQLMPLLMEARQTPAWLIGTVLAMGPLGIFLAGPFFPNWIARLGGKLASLVAILVISATLVLFKYFDSIWAWMVWRFAFGIAVGFLFTVSESWVVQLSDENRRGQVMGFYTSVLAVTFGIGPLIIRFTGIDGWMPWLIGLAGVLLGLIPLFFVNVPDAHDNKVGGSMWSAIRQQPLIYACVLAATVFDSLMIGFFSIYAIRNGLSLETASSVLAFGIIASVFFYYPLGVLADRWSKAGVVLVCTAIALISSIALPFVVNSIGLWLISLLLLVFAFGVYVVALALLGDAFKGPDIVAGSAGIATMWGLGGLAGPPLAGLLIDTFGIGIFPYLITGIYVLLMTGLAANKWQMLRPVA
jgi:MFS family permease